MAARTNMSVEDRLTIVKQMISPHRQYSEATTLAQNYSISRQMVYYLEAKADLGLRELLTPTSGPIFSAGSRRKNSRRSARAR